LSKVLNTSTGRGWSTGAGLS